MKCPRCPKFTKLNIIHETGKRIVADCKKCGRLRLFVNQKTGEIT